MPTPKTDSKKSVARKNPPGFCPPWVSGFPSPKSGAQMCRASEPARFIGAAEHGWQHPLFAMLLVGTAVSDMRSSLRHQNRRRHRRHNCRRQRLWRTIVIVAIVVAIAVIISVLYRHPHPRPPSLNIISIIIMHPSTSTLQIRVLRVQTSSHSARYLAHMSHSGPDCSKLCRDIRELLRFLGAKPTSPRTTSTSSI